MARGPDSAAESLQLALHAWAVRRFGTAARFLGEAFTLDPGLEHDVRAGHRWLAARAAALAATEPRCRDPEPAAAAREALLSQATAWLEAEIQDLEGMAGDGRANPERVLEIVERWLGDTHLVALREFPAAGGPDSGLRQRLEAAWARARVLRASLE